MRLILNKECDYIQQKNGTIAVLAGGSFFAFFIKPQDSVDYFILSYFGYQSSISHAHLLELLHLEFPQQSQDYFIERIDYWLVNKVLLASKTQTKPTLHIITDQDACQAVPNLLKSSRLDAQIKYFSKSDWVTAFNQPADLVVVLELQMDSNYFSEISRLAAETKQAFMLIFGAGVYGFTSPVFGNNGQMNYHTFMLESELFITNYTEYLRVQQMKAADISISKTYFGLFQLQLQLGLSIAQIGQFLKQPAIYENQAFIYDMVCGELLLLNGDKKTR